MSESSPISDPVMALYERPGFMIRRANQIAVAIFLESSADLRVTTTQYGILYLLKHRPNIDQITIARLLGLDRSTTGTVLKSLEKSGLVARRLERKDRRRRRLELTVAGKDMLRRMEKPAQAAMQRLLTPLSQEERVVFLRLLRKLTDAFNETSRVPLMEPKTTTPVERTSAATRLKRTTKPIGSDRV